MQISHHMQRVPNMEFVYFTKQLNWLWKFSGVVQILPVGKCSDFSFSVSCLFGFKSYTFEKKQNIINTSGGASWSPTCDKSATDSYKLHLKKWKWIKYLSRGHNLRTAAFQTFAPFINTKQHTEPQCLLGTQLCTEKVSLMGGLVAKKVTVPAQLACLSH